METVYNLEQIEKILDSYRKASNIARTIGESWRQESYTPETVKMVVERDFPQEIQPIVKRLLIKNFPDKRLEGIV